MNSKTRVLASIIITILLLAAAVLIWANQTHKITIWGDTWTIGKWPEDQDNKIIEISVDGGDYVLTNSTTTYWKNGAVTKVSSVSSGPVKTDLTTCYTQSELNNLLTILDNAGFWQANDTYTGSPFGEAVWATKNNVAKKIQIFPGGYPFSLPINLRNAFVSILTWPNDKTGRTLENGVCNFSGTTQITTSSTPTNWITAVKTSSENPTQEFTVNTNVSPTPSGTCNVGSWEATKVDSRLKLKGPLASVFSDKANGSNFVGDATGCESLTKPQTKFTAQYDITGLTKGVYSSEITLIGKYLDNTSTSVKIPVNITVTDSTTQTDTQAPTAPENMNWTTSGNGDVNLTWNASSDNVSIDHYQIYVLDQNNISTLVDSTKNLTYTIPGGAGCDYKGIKGCRSFYVIAYDAAGNYSGRSSNSNTAAGKAICPSCVNPTPTPTPTPTTSVGPTITKLISTGQALWFNIGIALILSAIVAYFIIRKKPDKDQNIETYNNY